MMFDVKLNSNSDYWQASWTDQAGQRCRRSIGAKKDMSKRQARKQCQFLAVDLNTGKMPTNGHAPKLSQFIEWYHASRIDLAESTRKLHDMTGRYLLAHFGDDRRIDRITKADATTWRTALASGDLEKARTRKQFKGKRNSASSIAQHVRIVKTIFGHAVANELIASNPFSKLSGRAPDPEKDWRYVSIKELDKLIKACPNHAWKTFLGLLRLAGLRRGEALNLEWSAIDWENHRITVVAQKTRKRREVPIEKRLFTLLLKTHEAAVEGEPFVLARSLVAPSSVRNRFLTIIKHAKLDPWDDLFQVLRRARDTDWKREVDGEYIVDYWMGHGMEVSRKYYLQVPDEAFVKASGIATKTATKKTAPNRGGHKSKSDKYTRQGSNLQPSAPEADALSN